MSVLTIENARQMICDLIALPTVNPMGGAWSGSAPVERPVTEYLEARFARYGVSMERQAVNAAHENLLIALPGREDIPATLFESHMDTVPADDWPDRAWTPRVEGDLVYGRGACDDKGCLAAMALAVMDLLETGEVPQAPVLFLAAGDEEYAQTGIIHFRESGVPVGRGIFGEPTSLVPVVQHRGTLRWDITVHGRSAHTARRELGVDAIAGAVRVIAALRDLETALQARFPARLTPGPALTVTMIRGGRTRNAVADECTVSVDFRLAPGMTWEPAWEWAKEAVGALGLEVTHHVPQMTTPALATDPEDPFSRAVLEICRAHAGDGIALAGMPYGTDAAWVSDRCPALVLGPGDIASAHAIDEFLPISELLTCARIYREILTRPYV